VERRWKSDFEVEKNDKEALRQQLHKKTAEILQNEEENKDLRSQIDVLKTRWAGSEEKASLFSQQMTAKIGK
jgi:type II secretory pathway component PulF